MPDNFSGAILCPLFLFSREQRNSWPFFFFSLLLDCTPHSSSLHAFVSSTAPVFVTLWVCLVCAAMNWQVDSTKATGKRESTKKDYARLNRQLVHGGIVSAAEANRYM